MSNSEGGINPLLYQADRYDGSNVEVISFDDSFEIVVPLLEVGYPPQSNCPTQFVDYLV
jgi:hypothetical protein